MSSTVADALVYLDNPETTETRLFIRLIDQFFDCLNVTNKLEGVLKRKEFRLPYTSPGDHRFKVSRLRDARVHVHPDMLARVQKLNTIKAARGSHY